MSLAYESDDSGRNRWLCLKSLHGVSKARMKSMKIVPVYKGKPEILREVSASWVSMSLRSEHGSMGNYIFGAGQTSVSGGQEKIMGL